MTRCICTGAVLSLDCPIHGKLASEIVVEAIDRGRIVKAELPGRCELCDTVAETRPYGPSGEQVCFQCGIKDEAAMKRGFHKRYGP